MRCLAQDILKVAAGAAVQLLILQLKREEERLRLPGYRMSMEGWLLRVVAGKENASCSFDSEPYDARSIWQLPAV